MTTQYFATRADKAADGRQDFQMDFLRNIEFADYSYYFNMKIVHIGLGDSFLLSDKANL